MFRSPETYEDLMYFRRCWSMVYMITGLLLVVLGMASRTEVLYCKWGTEILRILPAAGLGIFLVWQKKPTKIIAYLAVGKWNKALCIVSILLIFGNRLLGLHTPMQIIAQFFSLALFSISCKCIRKNDASPVFHMTILFACFLLAGGSVIGAIACLLAGLGILYRMFSGGCRRIDPQWRLSKRSLALGLLLSIAMLLIALQLHLPAWKTDGIFLMRSARSVLKHALPFGFSRHLGEWAIDYEYAMGYDVTGYMGTLVGHSLGWVFMACIFLIMVIWLISGAFLCFSPMISVADMLVRIVSKLAWLSMAVPTVWFLLQNLGLLPYVGVEAPLLTRNVLSQTATVFLSYLILIIGPDEPEEDPKYRKVHREEAYTNTIVGTQAHDRQAA